MSSIRQLFNRVFSQHPPAISWDMDIPPGKYAIIAGNHGFLDVYKEVLKEIDRHHVIGIFHAGDICGHGLLCGECLKTTVESNIMAIKGNHDRFFLGIDGIYKYDEQYALVAKESRRRIRKKDSKNFKKYLELPDQIRTEHFDIAHDLCYPPFYGSRKRRKNEDFLYSGKIKRPVFIGSRHKFYILYKKGVNVQRKDLPFRKDISLKGPCIISVPSMNYSKQKDAFCHAYIIVDIPPDRGDEGRLKIRAYDIEANFVKDNLVKDKSLYSTVDSIKLTSKQYHYKR